MNLQNHFFEIARLFGLVFGFLLVLTSCQQTQQVSIGVARDGKPSQALLVFEKDQYEIEAHFPKGLEVSEDQVDLVFFREFKDGEASFSAGVSQNSLFRIRDIQMLSVNGKKQKIRIFFQVNHERLPPYHSPDRIQFSSEELFRGTGRIFSNSIEYESSTLRESSHCNAALVARDLVLTAQHCIEDQADCDRSHFVYWVSKTSTKNAQYEALQCESIVIKNFAADQTLIRLKKPASRELRPFFIPVPDRDFFFPNGTALVAVIDEALWKRSDGVLSGTRFSPQNTQVEKSLIGGVVEGSSFGFYARSSGQSLDPIENAVFRRSNVYDVSMETKPGQSGAPVVNFDGELIGVISATNGYITPLDPEIRRFILSENPR